MPTHTHSNKIGVIRSGRRKQGSAAAIHRDHRTTGVTKSQAFEALDNRVSSVVDRVVDHDGNATQVTLRKEPNDDNEENHRGLKRVTR